jgi:hypothetical protein
MRMKRIASSIQIKLIIADPSFKGNSMAFQISALPEAQFADLFTLTDDALRDRSIVRVTALADTGYPCRVSLSDAKKGETPLVLNYAQIEGAPPYAARHAIYVRETATQAVPLPNEIPPALRTRVLSVRAFDEHSMMLNADVVDGADVGPMLDAMFADNAVAHIDIHNAKQGCFAARAHRS